MFLEKMANFNAFLQIIEGKLHTIIALAAGLIFEILFFASIDGFVEKFIPLRGALYLIFILGWSAFWLFNKSHLPQNNKKKRKVGIVIAIFSENEIERQKLKADFMSKLKEMLSQEKITDFAEIFFLKNHFAEEILESNSSMQKIEEINKKIGAHFYVWGRIKKRPNDEKGEKYFLTFQGYVFHNPITRELSNEIAKDFSAVLPREISFLEREFRGFEASAKILHLAIKYIVGYAAFVSQNPIIAFRLHDGLREAFNVYRPLPVYLQDIRNKIPILISEETGWIARWHFQNNRLIEAKEFLTRSLYENNKNYSSLLFKAIIDFNDNRIHDSINSISNAEKYSGGDFTWIYSKAFHCFWQEDYAKVLKLCQKIKNQSHPNEEAICREIREFNLKILETDTSKPQLYFWIGFLSYFKDKNIPQALEDFEKFEQLSNESVALLKNKSSAYLTEIKRQMNLK
ncbi:MAG: hypothetical protein WC843_05390 [Candidatus Gracilibacteria bacterium]|jgi:hypothetical protein